MPECDGIKIYDSSPLVGFASALDPLYLELKRPDIIGTHHWMPRDWVENARTVIAFFLPFTREVVENPERELGHLLENPSNPEIQAKLEKLLSREKVALKESIMKREAEFRKRYGIVLLESRIALIADRMIEKGYDVQIEQPLGGELICDLFAVKGYGSLIVEVETGLEGNDV
jgi:hypothetical protein